MTTFRHYCLLLITPCARRSPGPPWSSHERRAPRRCAGRWPVRRDGCWRGFGKAEVFDVGHAHERKGIVDFGDADIARRDTGSFIKQRSRVGAIGFPKTRRLTLAAHARHDIDRCLLQIARPLRRGDHQSDAAVALLAAIKQSKWVNDPARALVLVDGDG